MSTKNLFGLDEKENFLRAEQSVIGSVLLDNSILDEVEIDPSDFSLERHQLLWKVMKYQHERNEPIDVITLTTAALKYGRIEDTGGPMYLTELAGSVYSTANIKHHVGVIQQHARILKAHDISERIKELSMNTDQDEFYDQVDKLILTLRPNTMGKMKGFAETEKEFFEYLDTQTSTIKTGFPSFDEWSGGIGRGWLYILAGRPSIGKTAKALQMAQGMSQAGNILIWSQEMSFNQLKTRILSNLSGINYSKIRRKNLDFHDKLRLKETYEKVNKLPIIVEDSGGVTIEHIRSTARQIRRTKGPIAGIFVDYLTKMDIKQEKGQSWSRAVGEVSKKSKWLAQELECPFIMLAQLSREGAKEEPQLHHLRDSGEIEQDADMVEFLWEAEEKSLEGVIVNSTIAKGRETGTRKFKYLFKGHIQRYEDYKL